MDSKFIFIPYNTPSSKNSRPFNIAMKRSFYSSNTAKYVRMTQKIFEENKPIFLDMVKDHPFPLNIEFTFIRDSKRKFDLINAAQIVQDLMVKYEWLPDDNYTFLKPFFGDVTIDKNNPGVIIKIYENK